MSFELAPGTILNEKYVIKKVLASGDQGSIYLAKDQKITEKNWVIKELIPPPGISEEDLAFRNEKLHETTDNLMHFDNPHLTKILEYFSEHKREYIVMEYSEGLSIRALSEMMASSSTFPENQVIEWMLQACDALYYLHDRPQPFIFDVLSPDHILLDQQGNIKLINYGLDRFYELGQDTAAFAQSKEDLASEMRSLGETIYYIMNKKKPDIEAPAIYPNMSEELQKIMRRLFALDPTKSYNSFLDLKKELDEIIHPSAKPAATEKKGPSKPLIAWAFGPFLEKIFLAVFANKIVSIAAEVLVVLLAIGLILFSFLRPAHNYSKSGPAAYIICNGNELWTIDLTRRKVINKKTFEGKLGGLTSNLKDNKLFVSNFDKNRIMVLDSTNNDPDPENPGFPVLNNPGKLFFSHNGKDLFVIHEPTNNIFRKILESPPSEPGSTPSSPPAPPERNVFIYPVGNEPKDLAVSRDNKEIFVPSYKTNNLYVINLESNITSAVLPVEGGPFGTLVSPNREDLFITLKDLSSLMVVKINSINPETGTLTSDIYNDTGGKGPVALLISYDGTTLYIANYDSGTIGVFNLTTNKLTDTITVGQGPVAMAFTPKSYSENYMWVINELSGTISVVDLLSNRVSETIPVGKNPQALFVVP
ncbi:MAG: protein kinase [Firmicutes bacterium]|nr:protein kinase [Bacillota bacterium]